MQSSNTSNLIFNVYEIVSYISNIMTLEAGDVIATGTPAGIGEMHRGDRVQVEIEGIGVLENVIG
jgi:2-keto-4-pentenoate hydratase/2-oxohepta-3-ene-1,7-dioic acid hydratase in catechol pathway